MASIYCPNALAASQAAACVAMAVFTPAVLADSDRCPSPIDVAAFESVAKVAETLSCNSEGFWEAGFGELERFVFIPGNSFERGSVHGLADERPLRRIDLDAYWMGVFPVTVGQFREFVAATGYISDAEQGWGSWQWNGRRVDAPGEESDPWVLQFDGRWNNIYFEQGDDHPVGSVSWNDANAYAAWRSDQLRIATVLPTEAQWEMAARGTDGRRFPWGNENPGEQRLNFADYRFSQKYGAFARRTDVTQDDGWTETSPVNAYPLGRSPYGVYDMAGNLGEWVYDIYDENYYAVSPERNPSGPRAPVGTQDRLISRVNRGGSWVDWAGVEADGRVHPEGGHSVRAAARTGDEQNSSDDHMGFRLAVDGRRVAVTRAADPNKPNLDGVIVKTYTARKPVYMLEASGDVAGNIAALVGDEGVLIVDDQFADLVPAIEQSLAALHAGDLRYILNTHHHDDHSDGNARLAASGEPLIIAHEAARKRLVASKGPGHWPVLTFHTALTLYFNDETVRLLSLPGGHTDNDIVVFFEDANVAHLGDLMNSGISSFPTADLDAGGNALVMRDNVARLLSMVDDDTVIIPGHGPLSNKAELHQLHAMLVETIAMVEDKRARGLPRSTIIAEGVGDKYRDWGYGYTPAESWLDMVWESLEQLRQNAD